LIDVIVLLRQSVQWLFFLFRYYYLFIQSHPRRHLLYIPLTTYICYNQERWRSLYESVVCTRARGVDQQKHLCIVIFTSRFEPQVCWREC